MNSFIKRGVVAASALAVSGMASAALPSGVSDSITTAGTDGVTLVGLLAAAGAGVFLISKVLKKFGVSL